MEQNIRDMKSAATVALYVSVCLSPNNAAVPLMFVAM